MHFLSQRFVIAYQAKLIDLFGGLHGVRDMGLLESALAQPSASFGGQSLHSDVWEMAAAYGFHLCANHAFLDGNKRIAAAAMITFLRRNGHAVRYDEVELVRAMLAVARGLMTKRELAEWLKKSVALADKQ